MLHEVFLDEWPMSKWNGFPTFWKLLIVCHFINPWCWRQWQFPNKFEVNSILTQLTDRARLHCNTCPEHLYSYACFHNAFFAFHVHVLRTCVTVDYKLDCMTYVIFVNRRPFSPEFYSILKTQVCRCLTPIGWAVLRTYQHDATSHNTTMRTSNFADYFKQ
jgi:hypothetical protein